MNQNWSINFGWVKAHSVIEGNEMADKLAKEAAEGDELNIVHNRITTTTVATELKRKCLQRGRDNGNALTKERFGDCTSRQSNRD
jgi:ribonuclease HI